MKARKGYHLATVRTMLNNATVEVEAQVRDDSPHLAWHPVPWNEPTMYTVTHLPSGKTLGNFTTQAYTLAMVEALAGVLGLDAERPSGETMEAAKDAIEAVWGSSGIAPARKVAPKRDDAPVELEPVYRPGFTPSREVQANDRLLAYTMGRAMAGDPELTGEGYDAARRRAFDAAWEDRFMVTMPGLKREEVPPRDHGNGPLRLVDGTLCNYEGFDKSRAKLEELGDHLLDLAETILELAEGVSVWDKDDRREWRTVCAEFSRLIGAGWMEWTACAAHYAACTPAEKRSIVEELGFVGAPSPVGYRALGMKTVFRHRAIRLAAQARQRVKDMD